MFRRSGRLSWTPNYFRHVHRPNRPTAKKVTSKLVAAPAESTKQGLLKHTHKKEEIPMWASSLSYVNAQLKRLGIPDEDFEQRSAREKLVRTAQELHSEWDQLSALLPEKARQERRAYLCFRTRQNVLGVLSGHLHVPLQPHYTGALGGDSFKKYRVVEDSEIVEGRAPPAPASSTGPISSGISRDFGVTYFSLEDLVVFLDLFHCVESENGRLLRQLLDEVNRFIFGILLPALSASRAESTRVRLPLPQLLYTLSELGIAEERMLQTIVCRPVKKDSQFTPGDSKTGGLLYPSLPLYTVQDLLRLMVALYRFGMQQDYAFERTLRALRVLLWKSNSPVARFQRSVKKLGADSRGHLRQDSHDENDNEEESSGDERFGLLLQRFPTLEEDLHCPIGLLVEAVTALSMSVFRPKDVLTLVANLLTASAHAELQAVLRSSLLSHEEKKATMLAISHQVHRTVHLYEEMNELQPLLAELLAWSCTVSEVGVVMDGGEDAAIPSERRAYYDHVTADLVKINQV